MKIKPDTNQRSSYGPQKIADSSSQSFHAMIEKPEFSGTLERNSNSQHVLTRDPFTALKGGIGDKKIPVIPVPDFDEPMKNKTPVFFCTGEGFRGGDRRRMSAGPVRYLRGGSRGSCLDRRRKNRPAYSAPEDEGSPGRDRVFQGNAVEVGGWT